MKKNHLTRLPFALLVLVSLVGSIVLNATLFGQTNARMNREAQANDRYGSFQVAVCDVPLSVIEKISVDKHTKNFAIYRQRLQQNGSEVANYIYTDQDYFLLSGTKLLAGRFPTSADEVLVDSELSRAYGSFASEAIGKSIHFGDKNLTISGIVSKEESIYIGTVMHTYIFSLRFYDENDSHSILINSERTPAQVQQYINQQFDVSMGQMSFNTNSQTFLGINNRGFPNSIENIISFVLLVCIAFLVFAIVRMILRWLFKSGFDRLNKWKAIAATVYFLGILIVLASFAAMNRPIIQILQTEKWKMIAESLFIVLIFRINLFASSKYANAPTIRHFSKQLVMISSVTVLCGAIISASLYTAHIFSGMYNQTTDFDYVVQFSMEDPKMMLQDNPANIAIVNQLADTSTQEHTFSCYALYTVPTLASLRKDSVSKGQQRYLRHISTDYALVLDNPITSTISLPIALMYANQEFLSRLGLTTYEIGDGECIAVSSATGYFGDGYPLAWDKKDFIQIQTTDEQGGFIQEKLAVKETCYLPGLSIDSMLYVPVLLVNYETFCRYSPLDLTPSFIFIDAYDVNIKEYLNGFSGLNVTDIKAENYEVYNRTSQIRAEAYTALSLLLALQLLHLAILVKDNKKNRKCVSELPLLENSYRVYRNYKFRVIAAVIGLLSIFISLSVSISYCIYMYYTKDAVFFLFSISTWEALLLPTLIIVLNAVLLVIGGSRDSTYLYKLHGQWRD